MKEYYNILNNHNIVEFDGENISVYSRTLFGTRYLPNIIYWKGSQEELIDHLKRKITFNESDLGTILNGKV